MPDCFAATDTGLVLIANGIDPVLRWNGRGTAANAGLPRPVYGMTGGPTGTGTIGGEPAVEGVPADPSTGFDGVIGSPGTFVDYVAYMRWVDADGNVSDFGPPVKMRVQAAGAIIYVNVPEPPDPRIVKVQIFRNTAGQLTTFYLDAEGLPAPVEYTNGLGELVYPVGFKSTKTDDVLRTQQAVPMFTDGGFPFAMSHAPPPDFFSVIVPHISRMFMAAVEDYTEGSVALTAGSDQVVGTGTEWPDTFKGRFLHVPGLRPVEVAGCSRATQTLTLLEPWAGASDPYSGYAIRPAPAFGNTLFYSNGNEPESWPAYQFLAAQDDGDRVRGLMPYNSFLYIIKDRHTYRLTAQADPGRDGTIFPAMRRGVLNQRCWAVADEVAYVMDRQGVYSFAGDQPQDVSGQIQNLFRDTDGPRINFACARWFHAAYSPGEQAIKFYVTIYGDRLPNRALVYYYRIGKWTIERLPHPVGASCVSRLGRPGGWSRTDDRLMLGAGANRIVAFDGATSDEVAARTLRVRSANATTAVVSGLPVGDLTNAPVVVSAGRGLNQHRLVVARSGDVIEVDRPWAVRPDKTSELILGGIACRADLSALRMVPSEDQEGCSAELRHRPSKDSTAQLEIAYDYGDRADRARPAAPGSPLRLDLKEGATRLRFDQHRERDTVGRRFARLSVTAASGRDPFGLDELLLNGFV